MLKVGFVPFGKSALIVCWLRTSGITSILRRAGASNSRLLLIDTDSQGHASLITTGRNDYGADDSLYALLTNCIVASSM
ncbi:MAG: hypothetical protein H7175_28755 [Burkholderiales bacterium]|nr:hypothetical protein [Anaerolineae bacterium]